MLNLLVSVRAVCLFVVITQVLLSLPVLTWFRNPSGITSYMMFTLIVKVVVIAIFGTLAYWLSPRIKKLKAQRNITTKSTEYYSATPTKPASNYKKDRYNKATPNKRESSNKKDEDIITRVADSLIAWGEEDAARKQAGAKQEAEMKRKHKADKEIDDLIISRAEAINQSCKSCVFLDRGIAFKSTCRKNKEKVYLTYCCDQYRQRNQA